METVILANGKPAVELSFSFETGYVASTGEIFALCGHLDRMAKLNEPRYIVDLKTTKGTLGPSYFSKFGVDNQFSLYLLAGKMVYHEPVAGIIVDGVQVLATMSRFQRHLVPKDALQIDEWYHQLGWWLSRLDECAERGEWPMNDSSCDKFGGCRFRDVCSKSPASRQMTLDANYTRRVWDPLQRRGDV
jgi:hypothetical protein